MMRMLFQSANAGKVVKYIDEAAPLIDPVAVEMPVAGEIAGVQVRGIIDLIDTYGHIIDLKRAAAGPRAFRRIKPFS